MREFMTDIFLDSARSKMDFAGVLEVDDETAYFYLCSIDGMGGSKIIESINIGSDVCDRPDSDFQIFWNEDEDLLAVLVGEEVRGAFELKEGSGSNLAFTKMLPSQITAEVKRIFQRH